MPTSRQRKLLGPGAYRATAGIAIIRVSDGAYIPADERNHDYSDYLRWVDEGNETLPAEPTQ